MEIVIQLKLEVRDSQLDEMVKQKLAEMEENGQYDMSQSSKEYEQIIQKLEAEVRNHIGVSAIINNGFLIFSIFFRVVFGVWAHFIGATTNETVYWKLSN